MENQKGAALIIVLSLLSISIIIGVSSFQSSNINEMLAGNYRASVQSQMLAENAASEGFEKIGKDTITWQRKDEVLADTPINEVPLEKFLAIGHEANCPPPGFCHYLYIDGGNSSPYKYIVSIGGISSEGNIISVSEVVLLTLEISYGGGIPGELAALAGSTININGASTVDGRMHANIDLNANLEQRDNEIRNEENQGITSGFEVPIPSIDFNAFDNKIGLDRQEGKGNKRGTYYCEFNKSGNLSGKVYYCDGDLEIGSSFENATLLSSGNVTNKGSVTLGRFDVTTEDDVTTEEDYVTTEIVAKGDISFSGASVVYGGWFLSGRDINQNGSSVFYGSMIAHRNINRNGSAEFIFKPGGGGNLESPSDDTPRLISWN